MEFHLRKVAELWTRGFRNSGCKAVPARRKTRRRDAGRSNVMDGNIVGLAAVIMVFGIPIAAMYTYYRVRKLRAEERLAAIARGVSVPMEPELSQAARTRRSGILLVSGAIGYTIALGL